MRSISKKLICFKFQTPVTHKLQGRRGQAKRALYNTLLILLYFPYVVLPTATPPKHVEYLKFTGELFSGANYTECDTL